MTELSALSQRGKWKQLYKNQITNSGAMKVN